jgi:chemotaxis response regulator CheB
MNVLIVDDSLLVLKKVESQIKDMDDIYEVILCTNPFQALDIMRRKKSGYCDHGCCDAWNERP